jgi:rRNA maturation protein Nop10
MSARLFRCSACGEYTMSEVCSCGSVSSSAHYKFSRVPIASIRHIEKRRGFRRSRKKVDG